MGVAMSRFGWCTSENARRIKEDVLSSRMDTQPTRRYVWLGNVVDCVLSMARRPQWYVR